MSVYCFCVCVCLFLCECQAKNEVSFDWFAAFGKGWSNIK